MRPWSMRSWLEGVFELSGGALRNSAMEGIRGLAVVLVFLVHYNTILGANLPRGSIAASVSAYFGAVGHTGVDLFFILSGYLIYGIVTTRPIRYGLFLRRRAVRIYPVFAVVFVLATLYFMHSTGPDDQEEEPF